MATALIKKLLIALLVAAPCFGETVGVGSFKYLNSNENSTIIDATEAQDLLNVDITPGGKSVKKRSGYGLYKTVFSTSLGVHGGYHAYDTTGNDVQIWASSVSVKGVVADGTPTTLVSSMTVKSTLDCADSQGSIYCVDSSRDFYIKTNGTTLTNWYTSPLGTMIEATPDRMAVSGLSATPNTIYLSQSNVFTNFTVGPLTTDAFSEVIAAPGSKLTHIRWGCQKVLWWKDQSFGYLDFEDQYTAQVKIVSDNIGTFDNTSAIDPGGSVWFRGQDGHIYSYDCSGLIKQTIEITPQIQASGRRTANSWAITSQSDFQTGSVTPTGSLSTTLSAGEIVPSTFTRTDTTTADFNAGTFTTGLSALSNSVSLSKTDEVHRNFGLEQDCFTNTAENFTLQSWSNCQTLNSFNTTNCPSGYTARVSGTHALRIGDAGGASLQTVHLKTCAGTTVQTASFTPAAAANCTSWTQVNLTGATVGKSYYIDVCPADQSSCLRTDCYLAGSAMGFYYKSDIAGSVYEIALDDFNTGIISSGTYTSATFDLGSTISTSTAYLSTVGITADDGNPTFSIQASSTSTDWTTVATSSGGPAVGYRYWRYKSVFAPNYEAGDDGLTTLDNVTISANSAGQYYSAVHQAANLSAWSTLGVTYSNDGGSHAFYLRSSSNTFTVFSSTPAWTAQTPGSQITISTFSYFQLRDDFGVTAATQTPTLSDFQFNWFEGSAADQAYMLYFDNAIWASVTYGVGISSNNYIFRRDLINDGWGLYGFGAGGMLIQNNRLFFGSVSDGSIYQFGTGTSDNGTAMSAYWKSKDYTGSDPFLQSSLTQIDVFAKQNNGQNLTATYTTDTSTATAYTISLDYPTQTYIQSRKLLPTGKTGYTFNFKVSDNTTTSAWEVFGYRLSYTTLPWKPTP